jgi:hypothetical protein
LKRCKEVAAILSGHLSSAYWCGEALSLAALVGRRIGVDDENMQQLIGAARLQANKVGRLDRVNLVLALRADSQSLTWALFSY